MAKTVTTDRLDYWATRLLTTTSSAFRAAMSRAIREDVAPVTTVNETRPDANGNVSVSVAGGGSVDAAALQKLDDLSALIGSMPLTVNGVPSVNGNITLSASDVGAAPIDRFTQALARLDKLDGGTSAPPPPDPTVLLTAQAVVGPNPGEATITWVCAENPAGGWTVARDGVDSTGYPAWSVPVTGATRSQTFRSLVAGRTYKLSVQGTLASGTVVSATAPVTMPAATGGGGGTTNPPPVTTSGTMGARAAQLFGSNRSGLPWISGATTGYIGWNDTTRAWETFRGSALDAVMAYHSNGTWEEMAAAAWPVTNFAGCPDDLRILYSLPLLPENRRGQWGDITDGSHDWVFSTIAGRAADAGHGDAIIRVGWEIDYDWPWKVAAGSETAFKAAFRRIVGLFRAKSPNFRFCYEMNGNQGNTFGDPKAFLSARVYPGDDVVDLVGVDWYDAWQNGAKTESAFQAALYPQQGLGPGDVVDFARAHGKGVCFNEWGCTENNSYVSYTGGGDNAWWVDRMFKYYWDNRDVVAVEAWFANNVQVCNHLAQGQMPNSAAAYKRATGPTSPYRIKA